MNKLFKGVHSSSSVTDSLIKKNLTTHLSNSVKEIQYCGVEDSDLNKDGDLTEATSQLCNVVEAIFLHGLKDSLTRRVRKALADLDEKPQPSFWAPLLVISHRQIIDQITHLSQISTEVGQCRAWVRQALNDSLLSSYFMTMRRDSGTLKSFYKPTAYVRDTDVLDVAQSLIEGMEASCKLFNLPCNSSLLNTWQLPSLYLAGIYSPTMKAPPVSHAGDVALIVEENVRAAAAAESNSETCSLSSAMSIASQNSGLRQMIALNEDEALKIILGKHKDTTGSRSLQVMVEDNAAMKSSSDVSESEGASASRSCDSDNANGGYTVGNSLNRRSGWSFDETQPNDDVTAVVDNDEAASEQNNLENSTNEPKSAEASYNALIESYNMLSAGYIKTPDLREVLQKFDDNSVMKKCDNNNEVEQLEAPDNIDVALSPKNETVILASQIGKICREKGLDNQNYECAACKQSLGVNHKPNVCAFTGEYFCDSCMSEFPLPIPARIIHNWDFKSYPISQKAFNYINEIKDHPTIDFKVLNPYIYGIVKEMAHLQVLRNQLNFLRAYLYTCREPVIEQLQKQMWPREYMYEHVHQYSISDLSDIPNGVLAQHLQSVVNFGKEHVLGCWLCSQKGFVCEVCNKPKALFPFDVENIYRCDICNAVYHKGCLNSSKPCPKCERKKKREDLPLLGATME